MKTPAVIALLSVSALASPCFAQQSPTPDPMHSPATRVGLVSPEVVAQSLREHGFTDVVNLRLEGSIYRAEARKNGVPVQIEVDAISGRLLKP